MIAQSSVIHRDSDVLGDTPVFVGTRVPVHILLDYLAAGDSIEEFLDDFPTVSREQAVTAQMELCQTGNRRDHVTSSGFRKETV